METALGARYRANEALRGARRGLTDPHRQRLIDLYLERTE